MRDCPWGLPHRSSTLAGAYATIVPLRQCMADEGHSRAGVLASAQDRALAAAQAACVDS